MEKKEIHERLSTTLPEKEMKHPKPVLSQGIER